MEDSIRLEISEAESSSLRELIAECVQKMKLAHETMARDQVEIEQMQAATRAILAREWKAA